MKLRAHPIGNCPQHRGVLARLAGDTSGNTVLLMAAGLLPLMAMIGGGVDMSRAYLAESRLQQACDAGVLAARKELGSSPAAGGAIPSTVATVGQEFFDLNFIAGQYGTKNSAFQMTLQGDYSISGAASVDVPTTLMSVFGYDNVPVSVACGSQLNFPNIDMMMVLDVTGSMRHTNAGDTLSRIDSLREVVKGFHAEIEANRSPESRMRYGFVPYSTNVNVGHLLQDDWVVDEWSYQSRTELGTAASTDERAYWRNAVVVSGSRTDWGLESTYPGTPTSFSASDGSIMYSCTGSQPANTFVAAARPTGPSYTEVQADPQAILEITPSESTENGTLYRTRLEGNVCYVESLTADNYVRSYENVVATPTITNNYRYGSVTKDVTNWRNETNGCIEERSSTIIDDYNNVDLTANLDLDIDLVPSAGNAATQWRPQYPQDIYARSWTMVNGGSWTTTPVVTTEEFVKAGEIWWSACPAPAQKLQEMTTAEMEGYLNSLSPYGATYHDVGMLWGARLLSPTGLFASENVDVGSSSTSRHLVFLTDGQTEPYDMAYGAYGLEPLDQRRWEEGSAMSLEETVNERFLFACKEAQKKNITVWVIAFGTTVNSYMTQCAGEGRYFEAADAAELRDAFSTIAQTIGDLRISS